MARSSSLRSRGRSYADRVVGRRDPIQRFLIVCEGEKTESDSFRACQVPREVVDVRRVVANTLPEPEFTYEVNGLRVKFPLAEAYLRLSGSDHRKAIRPVPDPVTDSVDQVLHALTDGPLAHQQFRRG